MPKLLTEAWARTQFRGKMLYDSQWHGDFQVTIPSGGDQIWFYYSLNEIKCKVSIKGVTLSTDYILPAGFGVIKSSYGWIFLPTKEGGYNQIDGQGEVSLTTKLTFSGSSAPKFRLYRSCPTDESI